MAVNVLVFVTVSLLKAPEPIERLQAHVFVPDDLPRPPMAPVVPAAGARPSRPATCSTPSPAISAPSAPSARSPNMPKAATRRSAPDAEADIHLLRFTEHLLASAIGAASSRLVLSLLLRRGDAGSQSALRLLDDASEALQYNRDLLQSALDQVRHGLSVFDKDMRLICWNRQFRELLELAARAGPGRRAARQDPAHLRRARRLRRRRRRQARRRPADEARAWRTRRSRSSSTAAGASSRSAPARCRRAASSPPIPTSPSASRLPRRWRAPTRRWSGRVRERTAELTEVNEALAVAKRKADEANLDKTRFLAAASHDVLQPLNAARLYATSLVERPLGGQEATLARNIDASLEAVEEILGVLIEISRLDTGRLEPDITVFPLQRGVRATGGGVRSRWRARRGSSCASWRRGCGCARTGGCCAACCRTSCPMPSSTPPTGKVLLGVRRRGDTARRAGLRYRPRHPQVKRTLIFKEFERLEETASTVRGLGLGLSIVERIGKVLDHRIDLQSVPGRGSMFSVELPQAEPERRPSRRPIVGAVGRAHRRADRAVHRQRARRSCAACRRCSRAGDAASSRRRARRKPSRSWRERLPAPDIILADYHLDDGTGVEAVAAVRAAARVAGAGDRHHRRSFGGGAARGAPARLRPAAQAAQGGSAARARCISSPGSGPWRRSSQGADKGSSFFTISGARDVGGVR